MPAISPNIIVQELLNSLYSSGGSGVAYVSDHVQAHPREFVFNYLGEPYSLWVYVWSLTHGGRSTLPDEYRIQMTSVSSPLVLNPKGYTVLLGYYSDLNVFAGFDLEKHTVFTSGSPSVQIDLAALHSALQNGLSFVTKDNDEIAIGVRPDQFINYCINAKELHKYGAEVDLTEHLQAAITATQAGTIPNPPSPIRGKKRKKIVENVSRFSRDARFKKSVANAYEHRCAVTRAQLRLIDAAHILPVAAEDSNDDITNGFSLSPTYHRAYDNSLIYLDEDYVMRLNDLTLDELKASNLVGGLAMFTSVLNKTIHLPSDIKQRPNVDFIRLANKYRRIPGY